MHLKGWWTTILRVRRIGGLHPQGEVAPVRALWNELAEDLQKLLAPMRSCLGRQLEHVDLAATDHADEHIGVEMLHR